MIIRKAEGKDLSRIAEIFVFNNRVNYFQKEEILNSIYVFEDGVIKGFIQMGGTEICKLYVDTCFQRAGIGNALIEFAKKEFGASHLWALEKNTRAIAFYNRHGFQLTGQRKLEEGTTEYLVESGIKADIPGASV